MFTYKNEAAFSKALVTMLRGKGFFVQRIESHSTGAGIPDIYAIAPNGNAIWLELKRVRTRTPVLATIPWRPGQQAWLRKATKYKQAAYTLVCFNDYIVAIEHNILYKENEVKTSECARFSALQELF